MLEEKIVKDLEEIIPLNKNELNLTNGNQGFGLIIVDEVNGFAKVGGGNLAPQVPNEQISKMVSETNNLAHSFVKKKMPIFAFLDSHQPGKPEPPYPPHCEIGTGEEDLVEELKWIEKESLVTLVRKDCINGFIGAFRKDGSNSLVEWIGDNNIKNVLVVGICTDICVMDFVLTLLSARNHGMLPSLNEVVVYEKACSTYDLPKNVVNEIGLPESASHPQNLTHYMGLYFMASRGAKLITKAMV